MFRRIGKKMVLATAGVLGLSASVEAAVLSTPVLLVDSGRFMSCLISNVSDRDTTVRVEVISFTGAPLADSGQVTLAGSRRGVRPRSVCSIRRARAIRSSSSPSTT
jgi:hypothetical protein